MRFRTDDELVYQVPYGVGFVIETIPHLIQLLYLSCCPPERGLRDSFGLRKRMVSQSLTHDSFYGGDNYLTSSACFLLLPRWTKNLLHIMQRPTRENAGLTRHIIDRPSLSRNMQFKRSLDDRPKSNRHWSLQFRYRCRFRLEQDISSTNMCYSLSNDLFSPILTIICRVYRIIGEL